ncbi:MAG: CHASE2 domain-containing protein [Geobacteraceae bacterium]|nr:CHASE2 domain-containing protein [Geobacteraceae bacterium]
MYKKWQSKLTGSKQALSSRLAKDKKFFFHFYVVVGFLIAISYHLIANQSMDENLANVAFDILIRVEKHFAVKEEQRQSPVYFFDIDHQTFKKWGEPLQTPRDKVAGLVEAAWRNNSKVVVLDILLDKTDCCNVAGDKKLRGLLEKMLRDNAQTKVIFPVAVGVDGERKLNIYDDLIDKKSANGEQIFFRGIPAVSASAKDLINRYWAAFAKGRSPKNNTSEILWSSPLLAAAIYENNLSQLDDAAAKLLSNQDAKGKTTVTLGGKKLVIPLNRSEHRAEIYTQRIRFRLIPPTAPYYESNLLPVMRMAGVIESVGFNAFKEDLAGKIVIIGNSSPDTWDIRQTPIGRLPGMYVVGNAVNTIVSGAQPVQTHWWISLMVEGAVIILAAFLFARVSSMAAQSATSAIFLTIALPVSWYLFSRWGLFFNFVIPVFGMSIITKINELLNRDSANSNGKGMPDANY